MAVASSRATRYGKGLLVNRIELPPDFMDAFQNGIRQETGQKYLLISKKIWT
jgi:hypothetical protein